MNLMIIISFLLFLINVEICYSFRSLTLTITSSRKTRVIGSIKSSKSDDYEKMKIDKSKLDDKEKERIAYIEKLSLEADDMVISI